MGKPTFTEAYMAISHTSPLLHCSKKPGDLSMFHHSQSFWQTFLMKFRRSRHEDHKEYYKGCDIHPDWIVTGPLERISAKVSYIGKGGYRCQDQSPLRQFSDRDEYTAYKDKWKFYHCGHHHHCRCHAGRCG